MPGFLIDTDVLIDALNGKRDAAALLRGLLLEGNTLGCCAVNIAEVFAGTRTSEEPAVAAFLGSLDYHQITPAIARRAGLLKRDWARKGTALSTPDTIIAAVAIEGRLTLVTRNARHFPMPEVRLLSPRESEFSD
jgi:predicted nucleic acid-binding protein